MATDPADAVAAKPVDPFVMSDEAYGFAIKELDARIENTVKCPSCLPGQFNMAKHFVAPPVVSQDGGMTVGGTIYPCVMLICNHCGMTRFHNAVVIGAFPASTA